MQQWLASTVAMLVVAAIGLGGFTFVYAKGYSCLTDNPEACANCHIMSDHLDAWMKSSHRTATGCNGGHTPHAAQTVMPSALRRGEVFEGRTDPDEVR